MAVAPPSLTKMGIHHLATAVDREYQPTLGRFRRNMREDLAFQLRGPAPAGSRNRPDGERGAPRPRDGSVQPRMAKGAVCPHVSTRTRHAESRHQILPLRSKKPARSSRCRHNVPSVQWKDCICATRPLMQLPYPNKSSSDIHAISAFVRPVTEGDGPILVRKQPVWPVSSQN